MQNEMANCDLVLISVNYFGHASTRKMLDSIGKKDRPDRLILVDNSCDDAEFTRMQALCRDFAHLDVSLLRSEKNTGYMGGLNHGWNWLRQQGCSQPRWLILCNNDLIFSPNFFVGFGKAAAELDDVTDVVGIAPHLVDLGSGKRLNPFMVRRPTKSLIRKLLFIYSNYAVFFAYELVKGVLAPVLRFLRSQNQDCAADVAPLSGAVGHMVYAAHGAIFILRSEFVGEGFDDRYFLYGEEVTVAERCAQQGKKIFYLDSIRVIHDSHASTGSKFRYSIFRYKKNAIDYVSKNYDFS